MTIDSAGGYVVSTQKTIGLGTFEACVDVVLSDSEAVVIEINPRLTTAYLGVRRALDENVAALALEACGGLLRAPRPARRRVRFTMAGRIVSARLRSRAPARP